MGKSLKGKELGIGISQRKDGLYTGRITVNGKRTQKYFKKLQECRQWVAEMQEISENGGNIECLDMTFEELFKLFSEVKFSTLKHSTVRNYYSHFNSVKDIIGNKKVREIKRSHIQQILNRKMELKASTVKNLRAFLGNIFHFAIDEEIITESPCKNIRIIGEDSGEREVLTSDEVELIRNAKKKFSLYDMMMFILETGLRIGEARGLRWDDVDFTNKCIYVKNNVVEINGKFNENSPKTEQSNRTVPLTSNALNILNRRKKSKIIQIEYGRYVFGKFVYGVNFNIGIKRFLTRLGINKRISAHNLRHTFATNCINSGMQYKTLQKILGHSTLQMTMELYVHTSQEDLFREIKLLEKLV